MNLYVVFCVVPFVIPMFRQKERENSSALLHHNDPFIRFLFLYTQQYNVYVRHNTFSRNNSIISFKFYVSVSTFDIVWVWWGWVVVFLGPVESGAEVYWFLDLI